MNISESFNFELNEKQREAFNLFKSGTSFFLSGPAGVGKSYLIIKNLTLHNSILFLRKKYC